MATVLCSRRVGGAGGKGRGPTSCGLDVPDVASPIGDLWTTGSVGAAVAAGAVVVSWRGRLGVSSGRVATSEAASSADMRGVVAFSRSSACRYSL
jgi:hypothetical protein